MKQCKCNGSHKSATDNEWCGQNPTESLEGTKYAHHEAIKTATNNQWVSRNMPDETQVAYTRHLKEEGCCGCHKK